MDDMEQVAPQMEAPAGVGYDQAPGYDQAVGYDQAPGYPQAAGYAPQLIYQDPQPMRQAPPPARGQGIQIPARQPQVLPIAGANGPQIGVNIAQPQQLQQLAAGQPAVQMMYPLPNMQQPGIQLQYMHPQGVPQLNAFGEVMPKNHFPLGALNRSPGRVLCPMCSHSGMTTITFVSGSSTLMWAGIACLCICMPCIPYLMTEFKDVVHSCASCGAQLATWHRDGGTEVHAVV